MMKQCGVGFSTTEITEITEREARVRDGLSADGRRETQILARTAKLNERTRSGFSRAEDHNALYGLVLWRFSRRSGRLTTWQGRRNGGHVR